MMNLLVPFLLLSPMLTDIRSMLTDIRSMSFGSKVPTVT